MWVVKLEEVVEGKVVSRRKIMSLDRPTRLNGIEDVGLRLEDGKALLAQVQALLVTQQFQRDQEGRSSCGRCGRRQRIKDYRSRTFDTVFGRVAVNRARFECSRCKVQGRTEPVTHGLRGRSAPEFDAIRAKFAALLPYRAARNLLCEILPVSGGTAHTTIRNRTFAISTRLERRLTEPAPSNPREPAASMTVGLDTAYVRAIPSHPMRHVHVIVGQVERDGDRPRYFAGIEDPEAGHSRLICSNLKVLGYRRGTKLTVLTDGDGGLRLSAREATGSAMVPILDWFHIAMRMQHLKQTARGLSRRVTTHATATAKIRDELDRLHWRLWHGRVDAVDVSLKRLRKSIGAYRRYKPKRKTWIAARQLWSLLHDLKRYVRGNANTIVDFHTRQRSGQRVSTSLVESAVNNLVNRRMNKSQQMRWSAMGAHRLLQVRAAVINGEFDGLVSATVANAAPDGNPSLRLAA